LGTLIDEEISYSFTAFASMEKSPLTAETQKPAELARDEETVLFCKVEINHKSPVSRYAWIRTPAPEMKHAFNGTKGFGMFDSGLVYCITKLNGQAVSQEEIVVLIKPGENVIVEFMIMHSPISEDRADKLAGTDFTVKLAECKTYWKKKLGTAAQIDLPEKHVTEMVRAGLLHLDIVAYGLEPDAPDAPIIQFMDSMGWHNLARRSLQFFLEKQHDDGFIRNFGGYMVETGAVLWSLGEHYRYNRDDAWVKQIAPKILKSCDYLIRWREGNKKEELRGKGYGMIDGKVGDSEDSYHSFMLNGYAYLGLSRAAEMLKKTDPAQSDRLAKELAAYKEDIRASFFDTVSRAPVVPLGNGRWCPAVPAWPETDGAVSLFAKGNWFTHGSFTSRDSLTGPLYLVFCEVLSPDEPIVNWLVNYHAELFCSRNVAFCQPYYCRNDWAHLVRGEIKSFIKTYFNGFTGLADRQTYSFLHEEAWFLMQTRWMLCLERGDTLHLLKGVPRAWLETGNVIEFSKLNTYFGPVTFRLESKLSEKCIKATIDCSSLCKPASIRLRVPHPDFNEPINVDGGNYDIETESVEIDDFTGVAEIKLEY
jgi:hypothetical protein